MARPKEDPAERFWAKVDKNGPIPAQRPELGPCWVWTAAKDHGYGRFWDGEKEVRPYRWIYEHLTGSPVTEESMDHLCLNKACVNPLHVEPVTHRENTLRCENGITAINARKTHCPQGHLLSGENLYEDTRRQRGCKICRREAVRKMRALRTINWEKINNVANFAC